MMMLLEMMLKQHEKSFSMTTEGKLQDVEVVSMDMV